MKEKPLIVIADNNKADRMLIKIAMDELCLDARVEEYSDGLSVMEFATNKCKSAAPKFIVLDLDMPQKNGLEILGCLQSNPDLCNVPVIVFASDHNENEKKRAFELGAIKYIAKSNSLREYRELVKFMKKKISEM
jgi:CheY-like chemotaxis protein